MYQLHDESNSFPTGGSRPPRWTSLLRTMVTRAISPTFTRYGREFVVSFSDNRDVDRTFLFFFDFDRSSRVSMAPAPAPNGSASAYKSSTSSATLARPTALLSTSEGQGESPLRTWLNRIDQVHRGFGIDRYRCQLFSSCVASLSQQLWGSLSLCGIAISCIQFFRFFFWGGGLLRWRTGLGGGRCRRNTVAALLVALLLARHVALRQRRRSQDRTRLAIPTHRKRSKKNKYKTKQSKQQSVIPFSCKKKT